MIDPKFPDGAARQYPDDATGRDVAASISPSLAKRAALVALNGEQRDLDRPLGGSGDFKLIMRDDPEALETIRHDAAHVLAASADFGAPWRGSDAPLVAWQDISRSAFSDPGRWRRLWLAHGFQSVVRIAFPLTMGRAFECYLFSARQWPDRTEPSQLAWSALNIWPLLKQALAQARNPLSPRELECLALAFQGLTARKTGEMLACSERTINFHLANAMGKLKVDNKLAAVQRACWFGLI